MAEIWEDGSAFEELRRRHAALADARDSIEAARKVRAPAAFLQQAMTKLRISAYRNCGGKDTMRALSMKLPCPSGIATHCHSSAGRNMRHWCCMGAQAMRKRLPPPGNPLAASAISAAPDAYLAPEEYAAREEAHKVGLGL